MTAAICMRFACTVRPITHWRSYNRSGYGPQALLQAGIHVPEPITTRDGRDYAASMFHCSVSAAMQACRVGLRASC